MICPICEKRKAKRFCPAKSESICSVCCGTCREVSIDCPADCPHLLASRDYDAERQQIDWSKVPFPESRIEREFVEGHKGLIDSLAYAICLFARHNRPLVDNDVIATLTALAEVYRTLASGIYYEKPPDYLLQRELYQTLQTAIAEYKKREAQAMSLATIRDSELRDALIFLAQIGFANSNGRPKGRAYIDLLGEQFQSPELERPASNLIVLP